MHSGQLTGFARYTYQVKFFILTNCLVLCRLIDCVTDPVGPGRSFLSQPSTLKNYKTGYYVSKVYPRYSMEKWQEAGEPTARQVLREKTQEMMSNLPIPEDHDDLMAKGEEFIKERSA